ncbi:MAG: LysR family transcriptional regulator, partial [Proteobacteria bacterium]|nr:LysR family transcriptional regulator [Pseudomonadota bacterium]
MATDLYNKMRLFTRVVEAGSFSSASQQLGVAPTSVSRQVAALENDLGTRLLNRTTRTHRLTDAGALYYERAKRILADIDDANLEISNLESTPRGILRITAPVTLGRLHVVPIIPIFLDRHPEIEIELTLTDSIVDLVENGIDLAVRLGELRDSNLITRRLAASPRIVIGSLEYLRKHRPAKHPSDLGQHNCLTFEPRHLFNQWALTGPDGRHTIRVAGNFTANNADALRDA